MSAEQSKHFRWRLSFFIRIAMGKTVVCPLAGRAGGEVSEDLKKVTDFAAKFDFTVENYALRTKSCGKEMPALWT